MDYNINAIMSTQTKNDRGDDELISQMIDAFQIVLDHKDEKGPAIVKCLLNRWEISDIPGDVLLAAYLFPSFANQGKGFYFANVKVMQILEEIRDHWDAIDPPNISREFSKSSKSAGLLKVAIYMEMETNHIPLVLDHQWELYFATVPKPYCIKNEKMSI